MAVQHNFKLYMQKTLYNAFVWDISLIHQSTCFLNEIGFILTDNEIKFIVSTPIKHQEAIKQFWDKVFIKHEFFFILTMNHDVIINLDFINRKFTDKEIRSFTFYYFALPTTRNRYIFKYHSINENLFKLIRDNTLWFTRPQDFRDDNDCKYIIDAEPTEVEMISFYYKNFIHDFKEDKKITLEEFSKSFKLPIKKQFLDDLHNHHYNNSISKIGVTCFSEKYDNKLMWDHYTNGYKGVCLVFDLKVSENEQSNYDQFKGKKVKYFKSSLTYFYDAQKKIQIDPIVFSKLKIYDYKSEIREIKLFESGESDRATKFNPKALKGILFGTRCLENDKREIIEKIREQKKYIDIKFMEIENNLHNQKIEV